MVEILAVVFGVVLGAGAVLAVARKRLKGGVSVDRATKRSARSIDAFALGEPWRRHVAAAQSAQRRFQSLVTSMATGPLRTRMAEIGLSVNKGVVECWEIAKRGDALDDTIRSLDPGSIRTRLERAQDGIARRSLESQMKSVERVRAARDDADERLRVLQTRLGELVSQAAEVSVGVDHTAELGSAVDDVVVQLEALRLATQEVATLADASLPAPDPALPEAGTSASDIAAQIAAQTQQTQSQPQSQAQPGTATSGQTEPERRVEGTG